jgi:hypothetical protein
VSVKTRGTTPNQQTFTWSIPACFIANTTGCGLNYRIHFVLNFRSVRDSAGFFVCCQLLPSSHAAVVSICGTRTFNCQTCTFSKTPCATGCFTAFVPNFIGILPCGEIEGGLDLSHPCGCSKPNAIDVFFSGKGPANILTVMHCGPPCCPCNGTTSGSSGPFGVQTSINCGHVDVPVSLLLDGNLNVIGCQSGVPMISPPHAIFTWGSATPIICPPCH